jgi:hypothetical protein
MRCRAGQPLSLKKQILEPIQEVVESDESDVIPLGA